MIHRRVKRNGTKLHSTQKSLNNNPSHCPRCQFPMYTVYRRCPRCGGKGR